MFLLLSRKTTKQLGKMLRYRELKLMSSGKDLKHPTRFGMKKPILQLHLPISLISFPTHSNLKKTRMETVFLIPVKTSTVLQMVSLITPKQMVFSTDPTKTEVL